MDYITILLIVWNIVLTIFLFMFYFWIKAVNNYVKALHDWMKEISPDKKEDL